MSSASVRPPRTNSVVDPAACPMAAAPSPFSADAGERTFNVSEPILSENSIDPHSWDGQVSVHILWSVDGQESFPWLSLHSLNAHGRCMPCGDEVCQCLNARSMLSHTACTGSAMQACTVVSAGTLDFCSSASLQFSNVLFDLQMQSSRDSSRLQRQASCRAWPQTQTCSTTAWSPWACPLGRLRPSPQPAPETSTSLVRSRDGCNPMVFMIALPLSL